MCFVAITLRVFPCLVSDCFALSRVCACACVCVCLHAFVCVCVSACVTDIGKLDKFTPCFHRPNLCFRVVARSPVLSDQLKDTGPLATSKSLWSKHLDPPLLAKRARNPAARSFVVKLSSSEANWATELVVCRVDAYLSLHVCKRCDKSDRNFADCLPVTLCSFLLKWMFCESSGEGAATSLLHAHKRVTHRESVAVACTCAQWSQQKRYQYLCTRPNRGDSWWHRSARTFWLSFGAWRDSPSLRNRGPFELKHCLGGIFFAWMWQAKATGVSYFDKGRKTPCTGMLNLVPDANQVARRCQWCALHCAWWHWAFFLLPFLFVH